MMFSNHIMSHFNLDTKGHETIGDENPKTSQIQGPMIRSRTKQSMDILQ